MSICRETNKREFSDDILLTELRRDYGLEPVNNVNAGLVICSEVFNEPTYITNLTKIKPGLDENSQGVFIFGDSNIPLQWTFTGNTDTFSGYTGASFYYELYERDFEETQTGVDSITGDVKTNLFTTRTIYNGNQSFTSLITPQSFISNIDFTNRDTEYLVKGYYQFTTKECLIPQNINTKEGNSNVYNEERDWYLVTVTNPQQPRLGPFDLNVDLTPGILTVNRVTRDNVDDVLDLPNEEYTFSVPQTTDISNNCRLVTDQLTLGGDPTMFSLSNTPENDNIMVVVNGITLSPLDYTLSGSVITLSVGLTADDIITATYLDCDAEFSSLESENYQILSAITSGATSAVTTSDKVFYNTDFNKYEYYLETSPEEPENIILYLNGIRLTYGLDFYQSVSNPKRLIFDSATLNINDIVYIVYLVGDGDVEGDLGTVEISSPSVTWRVPPTTVNDITDGYFRVEVTEDSDISYSSPIFTTEVNYVDGVGDYATVTTGLEANKNYIYRIINYKRYYGLLNNIFTTTNISINGKIITNNLINAY